MGTTTVTPGPISFLANRFAYHPATPDTTPVHEAVRAKALEFAEWLEATLPPGRHQSLALTAVQEAMMWANAAVACDSKAPTAP